MVRLSYVKLKGRTTLVRAALSRLCDGELQQEPDEGWEPKSPVRLKKGMLNGCDLALHSALSQPMDYASDAWLKAVSPAGFPGPKLETSVARSERGKCVTWRVVSIVSSSWMCVCRYIALCDP